MLNLATGPLHALRPRASADSLCRVNLQNDSEVPAGPFGNTFWDAFWDNLGDTLGTLSGTLSGHFLDNLGVNLGEIENRKTKILGLKS